MKISIHLNDEQLKSIEPLLKRSNRTLNNFVQSLVLASIKSFEKSSIMLCIDDIGKVNKDN